MEPNPETSGNDRESSAGLGIALLVAALAGGLIYWSFGKWADVLVDFGRELYAPWRIAAGEHLYRDIAWFNGPLSAYLNALAFSIFGEGIRTLAYLNMALAGVLTWTIYLIVRDTCGKLAAFGACAAFWLVFACNQLVGVANYNFIAPYSHELTHGTLLAAAALHALIRFSRTGRLFWLAGSGAFLGLCFLTKPEVFLAAAAAVTLGAVLESLPAGGRGPLPRTLGVLAASALLPVALAIALLSLAMPFGTAAGGVFGAYGGLLGGEVSSLAFYREVLGIDLPGKNLLALAGWGLALVALFGTAVGLALAVGKRSWWTGLLAFAGVGGALHLLAQDVHWLEATRPLPLLLAATGVILFRGMKRAEGDERRRIVARLVLVVFALLMLAKIVLRARVSHYGFALAMPGTLALIAALLGPIPDWVARRGGSRSIVAGTALAVLAVASAGYWQRSDDFYRRRSFSVRKGDDMLFASRIRSGILLEALADMEVEMKAEDSVVVMPEGIMLNYLVRRRNPTPYINFMPPELILFGEREVLAALQASPPDWVVLVHKSTKEYGFPFFGRDYGQSIMGWVRRNYAPVRLAGEEPLTAATKLFGVQLMKRRGS